jgi:flavin-dependent dehydrogenase
MDSMPEVVVVGAGPAGLFSARLLSFWADDVLVVDQSTISQGRRVS